MDDHNSEANERFERKIPDSERGRRFRTRQLPASLAGRLRHPVRSDCVQADGASVVSEQQLSNSAHPSTTQLYLTVVSRKRDADDAH